MGKIYVLIESMMYDEPYYFSLYSTEQKAINARNKLIELSMKDSSYNPDSICVVERNVE